MGKDSKGAATINDVARLAGVSKRTVSRVINNSPKVNPDTREKIEKIIAELNYAPSKQARGLASSRSYLIGLVYDEPNAIVLHSVQRGILNACAKFGFELVVHPRSYNEDELVPEVLSFVARSKIDGLIVMPPISAVEPLFEALRENTIPYVRLAAKAVDEPEAVVVSNDRLAMDQVAELFAQKQCSDVAILMGPEHRLASKERFAGLTEALAKRGKTIRPECIIAGDFTYETARKNADKLLSAKTRPDAVFASNDQMAIAVMHSAEDLGIKVPQELLVVGYDDDPMASRLRPSLTTLKRPNEEMAKAATLKLIQALSVETVEDAELVSEFTPELLQRQSTDR